MKQTEVKIGEWLTQGFSLYRDNFLILLLTTAIAIACTFASFGLLFGPLGAGVFLIALRLQDGESPKPEVGEVFKGFENFGQTFLCSLSIFAAYIIGGSIFEMIPLVGGLFSIVWNIALGAATIFALAIVADEKIDFWPAILKSYNIVRQDPLPFAVFSLLLGLISASGLIVLFVGVVLTAPIYFASISVAYRDVVTPRIDAEQEVDGVEERKKAANI